MRGETRQKVTLFCGGVRCLVFGLGHVKDKEEIKGADRECWGYGGSLA